LASSSGENSSDPEMKVFQVLRIFRVSSSQIERLEAILEAKPKSAGSPGSDPLFVEFELEERRPFDLAPFEEYCRQNNLQFWKLRRRCYSKAEIEAGEFFLLADAPIGSDTDATQYTRENACPICGIGLRQSGPLIVKLDRPTKRKLFCVSLRQSNEWVIASEVSQLLKDFTGFRFGDVYAPSNSKKPLKNLLQIVIRSYLPRMATITNFSEYDPPMKNRCSCNRAGWNLVEETIYERSALKDAKDFNLTVERWYGGGIAGLNWPIVSQQVRRVILDNKLLSPACFDPVRVIHHDPGDQYKVELPLDTQARDKVRGA
jgi:hypothetical protein